MCCCGKPTINGEPNAYSWDGKHFSTRQPDPPELADGDALICDEPGRCGGLDSHAHHFRLVKMEHGGFALYCRSGLGDERIKLGCVANLVIGPALIGKMTSNERFWLFAMLYRVHRDSAEKATRITSAEWMQAAAEKRVKTRKSRGYHSVKVWIEPRAAVKDLPSVAFTS